MRSVGPRRSAGSAAQHALPRTARGKVVRSTLNNPLPSPFSLSGRGANIWMMITRRQRPDLVVGPRVWDRTGMLELEGQVLESPPSPSAVPHRSPSMGAGNLEWVLGLTTSDARHDMSVAVPPYIRDTDAVVVCCTRARPSVRTVASFKYHRTVHVWLGGQALRAQHSEWRCCVLNVKIGSLRYVSYLPPTSLARSCAAIKTGNKELELTA